MGVKMDLVLIGIAVIGQATFWILLLSEA